MKKVAIATSGGLGDQLEGLKCAKYIPDDIKVKIYSCSRDEVFRPLKYLFGDVFNIVQLPEKFAEGYQILFNTGLINDLKEDGEFYFVTPDLLYRGPHAFDYKKYNVSLPVIKSTRLLLHRFEPKNEIYLGLMTTTPGYLYTELVKLAIRLASKFRDYIIHLPILTKWANQDILIPGLPINQKPENLIVYYNPDFLEQLEIQRRCCYGIYTCNGVSHIAHHLGQTRLLLDPQYERQMWDARWKENVNESINIHTSVDNVVKLVETHIEVPQTTLLPHKKILNIIIQHEIMRAEVNWSFQLGFKF